MALALTQEAGGQGRSSTPAMWVTAVLLILFTAYFVAESRLAARRRARIPHRIHVNGTRGKSSVTRLLAAALRAGGIRTIAKTTGSSPCFIYPDGSETIIRRIGSPNIKEQLRVLRWVTGMAPDALVLECMALQPYTQWISEHRMVRATIGVVTNVRADHLDVMGPEVEDVERAFAGMVPAGATFVTAEPHHNLVLQVAAREQGTRYIQVGPEAIAAVTPQEMTGFSYLEHEENVALALAIAAELDVARDTALAGMYAATPDIGALRVNRLEFYGRAITWVNAFAANDPDSYRIIWRRVQERFPDQERALVVVNCRADRPDRSRQLGELAPEMDTVDRFVLVGTGTEAFARAAMLSGVGADRLYAMASEPVEKVFERLVSWSGRRAVVLGVGNIKDTGKQLDEYFRNRSVLSDDERGTGSMSWKI